MTNEEDSDEPGPLPAEAADAVLEWALAERLGGESAPNLVAAVHRRLELDPSHGRTFGAGKLPGSRPQWLAAAMVLLGTLVVVGAALWQRPDPAGKRGAGSAPAADAQDPVPTPVRVRTVADVNALPSDVRSIEVVDAGDEVVFVLQHQPRIEHLCLAGCERITDLGLAAIAQLRSLRTLDVQRMRGLTAASALSLMQMESLRELDLRQLSWVTAEVVAQLRRALPDLARLRTDVSDQDLEAALAQRGLTTANGIEGLRRVPASTTELRLRNGGDLGLLELRRLTALTVLELAHHVDREILSGVERDRAAGAPTVEGLSVLRSFRHLRELRLVKQPTASEELLGAVREIESLRVLQLSEMTVTDVALQRLADMRLQQLSLSGCRGFGVDGMRVVAGLGGLRKLHIYAPDGLPSAGFRALAGLPHLEELSLEGLGGRSVQSPGKPLTFFTYPQSDGYGFTIHEAAAIAKIATLQRLTLRGLASSADELIAPLAALPALVMLDLSGATMTAAALEPLPPTLQRLQLGGCKLHGPFGETLAKGAPALTELDLANSPELGDVGLRSLRAVGSLRKLDLSACHSVSVDAIASLEQLEELVVRDMPKLDTQAMLQLRAMPRLQWLVTERIREKLR